MITRSSIGASSAASAENNEASPKVDGAGTKVSQADGAGANMSKVDGAEPDMSTVDGAGTNDFRAGGRGLLRARVPDHPGHRYQQRRRPPRYAPSNQTYESVSESQLPHKTVNLIFQSVIVNTQVDNFVRELTF